MRKIFYLMFLGITISAGRLSAQEILPGITVKNYSGKVIVSWRNQYPFEVKTINIQRSFDSSKNFTTIGSVINPQNSENGFVDENPPYNKMYYRLFISFVAGDYIFSDPVRPVKELLPPSPLITQEITVVPMKKITSTKKDAVSKKSSKASKKEQDTKAVEVVEKSELPPVLKKDKSIKTTVAKKNNKEKNPVQPKTEKVIPIVPDENAIPYPSRRIYAAKDNNIVINLPDFESKKYIVKFFDEAEKPLFEINRIKEDYLIVEKMNFLRAGWFHFEIYENGKMIEKNKFFIPKDGKIQ